MKLIMTFWVKNEEDIIEENILYHLNSGVDFIIATDNNSTDNTRDILLKYEKQNVLKYYFNDSAAHEQNINVKKMAQEAYTAFNADWVINNDADEFWVTSENNIRNVFNKTKDNYVVALRSDFIYIEKDVLFYNKMIYKRLSRQIKCAHRGARDVIIGFGNHWVKHPVWGRSPRSNSIEPLELEILHYPLRNPKQILNKTLNGTQAILKNNNVGAKCCEHWKSRYTTYKKNNSITELINSIQIPPENYELMLKNKTLYKDERLSQFFNVLHNQKK